eukprot:GILI01010125.1.p1 GENE.GILI01010125.1~~GILI01010125.1.p1  ORF type:complete len:907 (-),score=210.50 GILI01010125.1:97-2466(-)
MYHHDRTSIGVDWLTYVRDTNDDDVVDPERTRFTVAPTGEVIAKSSYTVERVLQRYREQKLAADLKNPAAAAPNPLSARPSGNNNRLSGGRISIVMDGEDASAAIRESIGQADVEEDDTAASAAEPTTTDDSHTSIFGGLRKLFGFGPVKVVAKDVADEEVADDDEEEDDKPCSDEGVADSDFETEVEGTSLERDISRAKTDLQQSHHAGAVNTVTYSPALPFAGGLPMWSPAAAAPQSALQRASGSTKSFRSPKSKSSNLKNVFVEARADSPSTPSRSLNGMYDDENETLPQSEAAYRDSQLTFFGRAIGTGEAEIADATLATPQELLEQVRSSTAYIVDPSAKHLHIAAPVSASRHQRPFSSSVLANQGADKQLHSLAAELHTGVLPRFHAKKVVASDAQQQRTSGDGRNRLSFFGGSFTNSTNAFVLAGRRSDSASQSKRASVSAATHRQKVALITAPAERDHYEVGEYVTAQYIRTLAKANEIEAVAVKEEAAQRLKKKKTTKTKGDDDDLDSQPLAPFGFTTKRAFEFWSRSTTVDELVTFIQHQSRFHERSTVDYYNAGVAGSLKILSVAQQLARKSSGRATSKAVAAATTDIPTTVLAKPSTELLVFPIPELVIPFEKLSKTDLLRHALHLLTNVMTVADFTENEEWALSITNRSGGSRATGKKSQGSKTELEIAMAEAVAEVEAERRQTTAGKKRSRSSNGKAEADEGDNADMLGQTVRVRVEPTNSKSSSSPPKGSVSTKPDSTWTVQQLLVVVKRRGLLPTDADTKKLRKNELLALINK